MTTVDTPAATPKGAQTRSRILDCALKMFRDRGYDATTMRAIAKEAGVSLGNTYYYFASKDHLIHAYYAQSHRDHLAVCAPILDLETDLETRLVQVLKAKIDTSRPYHRFARQLFRTAADPASPLSPFSDESQPVRRESTELLAKVVDDSSTRVTGRLAAELPELLWTYQMGIILYWIHDDSEDCRRTHRLIEHTGNIVVRTIRVSRLPVMRPLVRRAFKMLDQLRQ